MAPGSATACWWPPVSTPPPPWSLTRPRNAHAHLIALKLGNHLTLPVVDGHLGLGRYQAVLLVELDGPRQRQVLLQLCGV